MSFVPKKQIRLQNYDYTQPGYYFVTICTEGRMEYFGQIINGQMNKSEIGITAEKLWRQIPISYGFVSLDESIIMPNHLHGIVIINPHENNGVPWHAATGLQPLVKDSLQSIINHYKGAVKKECNRSSLDFLWQSKFYDHVIRKDESLDKIRKYIQNNPLKWELDRNNPESLWM
jgi:REP element-mobilizing transposase RayT